MNKRFVSLLTLVSIFLLPAVALAAPEGSSGPHDGLYALAMGLGMGIAAFGAGMGQGRIAGAALEGMCRNPNATDKVSTWLLLSLAFPESLVIFVMLSAFMIYGKFGM